MVHMDGAKKVNLAAPLPPLVPAPTARRSRKKTAPSAASTVRWASKIKQALSLQISVLSCGLRQASRANPNSLLLVPPTSVASSSLAAENSTNFKQTKKTEEAVAEGTTINPTVLVSSSSSSISPPQLITKQTPGISGSSREESDILGSDHRQGDILSEAASDERIIAEVPSTVNIGPRRSVAAAVAAVAAAIEEMGSPTASSACSSSQGKFKDADLSVPWPSPTAEVFSGTKGSQFSAIPDLNLDCNKKAMENTKKSNSAYGNNTNNANANNKSNKNPMKESPKEAILMEYGGLKPLGYASSSSSSSEEEGEEEETHDGYEEEMYEEEQYEEEDDYYQGEGEEEEEEGDIGEKEEQMRDLRDLEEFIECYRRLSCPQYRELVDHFFNDLCNELMQPLGSDNSFLTLALFRVSQMCSLNL